VSSSLSTRGGQLLIAAEVALAVILVAGAGLMIRSFLRLSAVDLGFNPESLLTMQVLPLERSPAAHKDYYTALIERLRTTPGIASVGLADYFALSDGYRSTVVSVAGKSAGVGIVEVLPGYFETIGATLRDGRLPSDADYRSGVRTLVINDYAARTLFPGGTAVGRELIRAGRPWTVVGVIADLRHGGPLGRRSVGHAQLFFPLNPTESGLNTAMTVVIRPSGEVTGDRLRQAAQSMGPRVLVEEIRTANDWFGESVITPRRRTVLLGLLGGLGLILALVGVFGMTAYAVTRRTGEIGVRMAFGARPGQVVRTIVADAAAPIAAGTLLGIAGASLASRLIESFLFETAPEDPLTLAVVAVTLAATGCIAALVPALRAARVDPAQCLRAD
jgi:predicted permease